MWRTAVTSSAPFTIGEPELGEAYSFGSGTEMIIDGNASYTLTYGSSESTIRYTASNQTEYELDGEPIGLNGRKGFSHEYGESATVLWEQDTHRYTIGGNADRETIGSVATTIATNNSQ